MNLTADLSVDTGETSEHHERDRATYTVRQAARERQRERERQIAAGVWPGYAASVQDLEHPGRWVAIVLLNRGERRYVRKESFARFNSSEEAFDAAERWLARELEKTRRL